MSRCYYQNKISSFIFEPKESILGKLAAAHEFSLDEQQKLSWQIQIELLQSWLTEINGHILFEYSIPRMGKRIDCIIILGSLIYAIEFKVGSDSFNKQSITQVMDYALDLKNFHEASHKALIIPILICTKAVSPAHDSAKFINGVAEVLLSNGSNLNQLLLSETQKNTGNININAQNWTFARYKPTPTIIEAAQALYSGHSVENISRSDAGAINLSNTAETIKKIIANSKKNGHKSICFLTGVPGAGKTLAGLNLASSWHNSNNDEHAVFLSGNGPLVDVLREALARNEATISAENGLKVTKSSTLLKSKAFIQNIHHFRDSCLQDKKAPIEKVVIFDEAQRAWTVDQTAKFMRNKKGISDFDQSEPEFLISAMDRHEDWATIICLIGGGQEINTGEAGLQEWFSSIQRAFPDWHVHISSKLHDYEFTHGLPLYDIEKLKVFTHDDLHLSVSIRSFRSEKVAALIKSILDCDIKNAKALFLDTQKDYPIFITRDIILAKTWLRLKTRGSERIGLLASSGGIRLKPFSIHVKNVIEPVNWFLNDESDVRSSYFLEDVATEFDVQGLELDWTCVAWDANLRYLDNNWQYRSFKGSKWQNINDPVNQNYLKNSYRVLLTRARQGMVIFVPEGSADDETRQKDYYDNTYDYLRSIGIQDLGNELT